MAGSLCLNADGWNGSGWSLGNVDAGLSLGASGLLLTLLLLPLVAAMAPWWLGERGRRVAVGALVGTALIAAYLAAGLALSDGAEPAVLLMPLWRVLTVNRLQLGVGLELDASAAGLLSGAALLGAWAVWSAAPVRAAWIGGACLATAVGLLADSLVLRLAGWEILTVVGFVLSERRRLWPLGLGRAGDAVLLLAAALLFWALGGSWSSSRLDARYQLDVRPPAASGATAAVAETASGPSLELSRLRPQLHNEAGGTVVSAARVALANKLWPGGRLLRWLMVLFALAAALKAGAALLRLGTERRSAWPLRLFFFATPILVAAQLLWRLW